jgi:hypothetical protein
MSYVPYASVLVSLMYEMLCTRLNIAHGVVVLIRYMLKPGKEHWTVVKRVFMYLCGTTSYGLYNQGRLGLDSVLDKHGYGDWVEYMYHGISISGYVFNLLEREISWMRKRQAIVALSIIEVEYMETTHASKEGVWLQRFFSSIGLVQQDVMIYYDSHTTIFLAKNPTYRSNTKHIDVQYHFVRDMVEDKKVSLMKVDTLKNLTDSLKKFVSSEKFSWCRETMGIVALDCLLCNHVTPCMKRKKVGECWVCFIFFVRPTHMLNCTKCARGSWGAGTIPPPPPHLARGCILPIRGVTRGYIPWKQIGGFCIHF